MKKLFLFTILLLAACTAPVEDQACCKALTATCLACTENMTVEEYCAENPETVGCESAPEVPEVPDSPEPVVESLVFDEPTQELQAKAENTRNYEFSYAPLPENKVEATYYVRGDIARVELYKPSIREADSFDVVYLDLENQRAVAYCELGNPTICPNPEQVVTRPDFADYDIAFPHQLIAELDNGELVGSITYDGHVADIVKSIHDGEYLRLTINRYYGIPMKIERYADESYTGEPTGAQNREFSFNSVSEEQVTPPSGW